MSRRTLYRAVPADSYSISTSNGRSSADSLTLTGYFSVFDRWTEIDT